MSARPVSKADRRALSDAMRHMLAVGNTFRDVRRGMDLSIRQMPRDAYLANGMAKRQPRGGRA
jgi:hypothetical protein